MQTRSKLMTHHTFALSRALCPVGTPVGYDSDSLNSFNAARCSRTEKPNHVLDDRWL